MVLKIIYLIGSLTIYQMKSKFIKMNHIYYNYLPVISALIIYDKSTIFYFI